MHLQLLRALRQAGEVDELREARQRMSELFPLTADLWREWLEDERGRVDSEEDQRRLLDLHARSCADYLVPGLWVAYCSYAEELHSDAPQESSLAALSASMQPVRDVYSQAEAALHCHCTAAETVMRPFRQMELQTLTRMLRLRQRHEDDEDDVEPASEERVGESAQEAEDTQALMAQLERLQALYVRSLSSPVNGLEQVYGEYRQWVAKQQYEVEKDVTRVYQASLQDRIARLPFEKALSACQAESDRPTGLASLDQLSAWFAYISFEQTAQQLPKQPSQTKQPQTEQQTTDQLQFDRIVVLFERALTQCFLHADVWRSYFTWLDTDTDINTSALQRRLTISQRAVRNLPADGALWARLVQAMESTAQPREFIMAVYDRAVQAMESRGDQLLPLCTALFHYHHRTEGRAWDSVPPLPQRVIEGALSAMRYTNAAVSVTVPHIELCLDFFSAMYTRADISQEASDLEAARTAMEQWITEKASGNARVWSEWIRFERQLNQYDFARQLFPRSSAHCRPRACTAESGESSRPARSTTSLLLCCCVRALEHVRDWGAESLCYDWSAALGRRVASTT